MHSCMLRASSSSCAPPWPTFPAAGVSWLCTANRREGKKRGVDPDNIRRDRQLEAGRRAVAGKRNRCVDGLHAIYSNCNARRKDEGRKIAITARNRMGFCRGICPTLTHATRSTACCHHRGPAGSAGQARSSDISSMFAVRSVSHIHLHAF